MQLSLKKLLTQTSACDWQPQQWDSRQGPVSLLTHPSDVSAALTEASLEPGDALKVALGTSVLVGQGAHSRIHRRRGSYYLNADLIHQAGAQTRAVLSNRLAELDKASGCEWDLSRWLSETTLDVMLRLILSRPLGPGREPLVTATSRIVEHVGGNISSLFGLDATPVSSAGYLELKHALRALDTLTYETIAARRLQTPSKDLLQTLLDFQEFDDKDIRDELITLIFAGSETTSLALGWAFVILENEPALRFELELELARQLGGRTPEPLDLQNLPLLERFFQECTRVCPPVWLIQRMATRDFWLGHLEVVTGTTVLMSPYLTHRFPGAWPDPERFLPERFLPETARMRPPASYLVFGFGSHNCIGRRFAIVQGTLILATLLNRYHVHVSNQVQMEPLIFLRPDVPIRATLELRT